MWKQFPQTTQKRLRESWFTISMWGEPCVSKVPNVTGQLTNSLRIRLIYLLPVIYRTMTHVKISESMEIPLLSWHQVVPLFKMTAVLLQFWNAKYMVFLSYILPRLVRCKGFSIKPIFVVCQIKFGENDCMETNDSIKKFWLLFGLKNTLSPQKIEGMSLPGGKLIGKFFRFNWYL